MHSETWKLTKTEKNPDFVPTCKHMGSQAGTSVLKRQLILDLFCVNNLLTNVKTEVELTFPKYSELFKNIREKIDEAKGWRGMHSATKEGPNVSFD
jgi:hypothetical protein